VVRAAVSEMHPRTAVVLVYIDQSSVSKDKPDPEFYASSVLVTVEKNNNTWLFRSSNLSEPQSRSPAEI
jgi:Mce-associated membrane protein